MELRSLMTVQIVGGSTDKPTSKAKKQEALQIGQVVGQFGQQIPAAGMFIMRTLSKAFDNFVMTDEDWDMLLSSMQQGQQQPQPQGQPQQGGAPDQGGGQAQVDPAELRQLLAKLDPAEQAKIKQLISQGIPAMQAIKQVTEEAMQQQHGGQQQHQQP
jgi:hypothetical protein